MLKNYLKTAVRNLRRHKGYAAINVLGLAVGLACGVLIFLFVRSEWAVNDAFPDAERLYRVDSDWQDPDRGFPFLTLAPTGPTMQRVFPEVAAQTRAYGIDLSVGTGADWFREETLVVDPAAPRLFGPPMLHGEAATALEAPRTAVLRDDLARTLFGATEVVGRTLEVETFRHGRQTYTVTGVWKTLPNNSFTQFGQSQYRLLVNHASEDFVPAEAWTSWENPNFLHFVKLAPGTDVAALQKKVGGFIEAYAPEAFHDQLRVRLNPLTALYLTDNGGRGWRTVQLLAAIAALILLVAGINFANLSTARALTRAKEVGVRKSVGARRGQVAAQLLGEALLVSGGAALLALALARLGLRPFLALTGKPLVLAQPWDAWTLLALLGLTLVTGLAAGAYPAFVLSSFDPTRALKGALPAPSGSRLRRGLVVAQFGIAVVLLVGVATVHRQMTFMLGEDLGFQQEHVLAIDSMPRAFDAAGLARMETVKTVLNEVPGVRDVSLSFFLPGGRAQPSGGGGAFAVRRPQWSAGRTVGLSRSNVDDDFFRTYGLALEKGRFFSDERAADSTAVVLNEAAARALELEDDPAGQTVIGPYGTEFRVVGVVRDFHTGSLHAPIGPVVFAPVRLQQWYKYLSVRLAGGERLSEAVDRVRAAWSDVLPDAPFRFTFMDQRVGEAYRAEQQTQRVVGVAAGLALFVACLGLFGLAAFAARQRTKEIGIRKVLGASVASIVGLLTQDFLKLVLIAFAVAAPLAYLGAQRWLGGFAYRIELGPWVFLLAGGLVGTVALLAVSVQSVRAALANPTEALRDE